VEGTTSERPEMFHLSARADLPGKEVVNTPAWPTGQMCRSGSSTSSRAESRGRGQRDPPSGEHGGTTEFTFEGSTETQPGEYRPSSQTSSEFGGPTLLMSGGAPSKIHSDASRSGAPQPETGSLGALVRWSTPQFLWTGGVNSASRSSALDQARSSGSPSEVSALSI
jgi:hypothetical protein